MWTSPPAEPALAEGPTIGTAGTGPTPQERMVFAELTYRQLMERYFGYLYVRSGGNLPRLAQMAGIAKQTAYEWRDRFGRNPVDSPRPSNGTG